MDQHDVTGRPGTDDHWHVGSGKTSVADALGDLLANVEVANAVIDVDWLCRSWPCPPGDPFNNGFALRNLYAVAHNYIQTGVLRLVLAGVLESRSERDAYQAASGVPLTLPAPRGPTCLSGNA